MSVDLYINEFKTSRWQDIVFIPALAALKKIDIPSDKYPSGTMMPKGSTVEYIKEAFKAIKDAIRVDVATPLTSEEQTRTFEVLDRLIVSACETLPEEIEANSIIKTTWKVVAEWQSTLILDNAQYTKQPAFKRDGPKGDSYCFDYAFQTLNEPGAKPLLIRSLESESILEKLSTDTFTFLSGWGYEPTTTPLPGDLVVYFNSKAPLKADHYAVYIGNDQVRSKFGTSDVYEHPINGAPSLYGNFYAVFKKQG